MSKKGSETVLAVIGAYRQPVGSEGCQGVPPHHEAPEPLRRAPVNQQGIAIMQVKLS